jgi:pimeloyl-ACP methyl ester carboxylesterase
VATPGEVTMAQVRHPGLHDADGAQVPSRLIEIAGCDTYVAEAGEGPAVLLLHGFADTADCWRRVVPGLLRRHRVVAIDIPPFGRSGQPPVRDGHGLVDYYQEYFPALFDSLELRKAVIVGHSLGGAVALTMALEHPERVDRLVLVAPAGLGERAPWWWQAIAGRYLNWPVLLRLPNPLAGQAIRAGLRGFLEERLVYDRRRMGQVIDHFVDLYGTRQQFETIIAAGRSLIPGYDGSLIRRCSDLEIGVTLIWGREDRLAPPDHADVFATVVPQASVHVLDRCGHYPQIELPARVNALIDECLGYASSENFRASSRAMLSRTSSSVSSGAPRFRR